MKMKTSNLSGAALNWAVADAHDIDVSRAPSGWLQSFTPSTNWAQGGPIIEREGIDILFQEKDRWLAVGFGMNEAQGQTPLIAAMRCYVGSKLGNEIEIPIELESCV